MPRCVPLTREMAMLQDLLLAVSQCCGPGDDGGLPNMADPADQAILAA